MSELIKQYIEINRRKIRVVPEAAGLYPADDMPEYIQKLEVLNTPKPRKTRSDLTKGMVVVVLEGEFIAKRVIFIKQVDNYKALCCGPESINQVPFFLIDERFLLKTSTVIEFDGNGDKIDLSKVFVSYEDNEREEREMLGEEAKIVDSIVKAVKKIKFMRSYLEAHFNVRDYEGEEVPLEF